MEAVCIASGPSLTAADVELVKQWRRAQDVSRCVIVVNTSFRLAPWADYLFAMDDRWWRVYGEEARRDFRGKRYSFSRGTYAAEHAETMLGKSGYQTFGNSGAGAVMLARYLGASRVVLLGYDAERRKGAPAHWHPDHPIGLNNASSSHAWPGQFKRVARQMKGIRIINASRQTALTCFARATLEDALGVEAAAIGPTAGCNARAAA